MSEKDRKYRLGWPVMSDSMFITFEGPEGCGKTTQVKLLSERLSSQGYDVLATKVPGGCESTKALRAFLLDPNRSELFMEAEELIFQADHFQHIREVIVPALDAGKIVLCDRYIGTAYAYSYARGTQALWQLLRHTTFTAHPDLTFLMSVQRDTGLYRAEACTHVAETRIDRRPSAFHDDVDKGFECWIMNKSVCPATSGTKLVHIAGDLSIEDVAENCMKWITKTLSGKRISPRS